jgi:hypothetical protein
MKISKRNNILRLSVILPRVVACLSLVVFLSVASSAAHAEVLYYGFDGITDPEETTPADLANIATAVSQIYMEFSDAGSGKDEFGDDKYFVNFKFHNVGYSSATIAEVYFEDGTLLDADTTAENSYEGEVLYTTLTEEQKKNGGLPGGQNLDPKFSYTGAFVMSSDASDPAPTWGVNSTPDDSEWVNFKFGLQSSQDFWDVKSDLATGALRIGLHVTTLPIDDGSVSLILDGTGDTAPPSTVPEPTALVIWGLFGAGAAGAAASRRRRSGRWSEADRNAIYRVIDR